MRTYDPVHGHQCTQKGPAQDGVCRNGSCVDVHTRARNRSGNDSIEKQNGSEKPGLPGGKEQAEKNGPGREASGENPGAGHHGGPRLVERKTALRGQSICRPREQKNTRRRRTQADLYSKDPEIPYMKYETAHRDLVCSLMERQDRMNEEIFARLIDLEYRIEDAGMAPVPVEEEQ
jgi:hypothetical protein